jgi:septal ring factor EnvC (AmiA/AmiB activator)
MPKKIVTALAFFLFSLYALAQQPADKDALEQQRQQLKKEIAETEKALSENQKTTKVSVGQLSLINRKLDLQGNVISNISGEIRKLNDNIYLSQLEINKIRRILDTLKVEYAKSMVYAYKNSNNHDFLNFIFSANSFNDAIKRIAYLKSYRTYREMQAENILRTQSMLKDKIQTLSGAKVKKGVILKEQDKELDKYQQQKQEKAQIVNQLKGKRKELLAEIKAKKVQDTKVRNAISAMIRRELEIARKKDADEKARLATIEKNREKNAPAAPKTNDLAVKPSRPAERPKSNAEILVSSEADKVLNANFEKNKGSLPWPADGFVIYHYGNNKLPGNIDYYCQKVTIGVKQGDPVKAVFDGEVTLVSYIEDKQAVFIKHGKYFSVYSNLGSASVQRGDKVRTGQVIGKAALGDEDQGQVDFVLMKENDFVNPELWLKH